MYRQQKHLLQHAIAVAAAAARTAAVCAVAAAARDGSLVAAVAAAGPDAVVAAVGSSFASVAVVGAAAPVAGQAKQDLTQHPYRWGAVRWRQPPAAFSA